MSFEQVTKALDALEARLQKMDEKATGEAATLGKVTTDTKSAIDNLGVQQRELADRLLSLEQKGLTPPANDGAGESIGQQFVKNAAFENFNRGAKSVSVELKNTVTNTVGNTQPELRPMVGGAFRQFTLERLLASVPTSSNAIEYVRENVFTNSAAEATEGNALPESAVTTTLVTESVATVGHFIKISRQLAADQAALARYIDLRMRYGVDLRVENQIFAGNGTAPNMSGLTKSGNFTAHGYTAASLTGAGLLNNRFDLIGKMLGDSQAGDYPADVICLNPTDWWTMRLAKDSQNRYLLGDPGQTIAPALFGVPVILSNAITADNVLTMNTTQAGTFYNREAMEVGMSEQDNDNFQKLLVTLRAFRRCMLAVERPAAVRYGDLTPA
ncbi:phage major capsid protein [Aquabacterium sp. OR-4]|uniref:phage major capsid protein n=1 Tax=Aquabacterium sp. OR-4 TaxID=2978127 RepID=UPI0021B1D062|nr:phage major capsid protein [Aquabacterium sp. OR-4]MDT7836465.1 phage major capsid protein [Aquabacterium sp. OR-4]